MFRNLILGMQSENNDEIKEGRGGGQEGPPSPGLGGAKMIKLHKY